VIEGLEATSHTAPADFEPEKRHEVLGILSLAAVVLTSFALVSFDVRAVDNWIGPLGAHFGGVVAGAFGLGAWVIPAELALSSYRLFTGRGAPLGIGRLGSSVVFLFVGCAVLHLLAGHHDVFGGIVAGGGVGEILGEVLRSVVGWAGALVICSTLLLSTFVLRTSISLIAVARKVLAWILGIGRWVLDGMRALRQAWQEAKALEISEAGLLEPMVHEPLAPRRGVALDTGAVEDDDETDASLDMLDDIDDSPLDVLPQKPTRAPAPKVREPKPRTPKVESVEREAPALKNRNGTFALPPTSLLDPPQQRAIRIDHQTLKANAQRLVEKLAAYGVQGRVDEIHPGPVVTMYEFEPASGTKVSKIASLSDDLAMALAAQKVRIVAPIPGKARVGFELPNEHRQTVLLRQIVEDDGWRNIHAALPLAFGQDIFGQPVFGDLARMPHLLVAGATGAGKSVGINVMLTSLLMKKSPDEVRFLMIDPKVVELAVFDGIPHMLLPVVTDMKKAALALRWAVDEMERRYQLFADAGARNIETYNDRVAKVLRGEMSADRLMLKKFGRGQLSLPVARERDENADPDKPPSKLPHIVVVVDEFADLMMVAAKDVEAAIARLAQKARAAGIHVILATQRPSVDVITGMIKANFPARVAFKVSQREDSKTILGRMGAEHLLGMGDMLMIPPGSSDLKRVHCAYISEEEVRAVCDHLRAQAAPVYDDDILKPRDDDNIDGDVMGGAPSDDPMYDRAVAIVAQAGYCSISHLQRHLSVGYNKAAKLVERMEKEGVVGPASSKAGGRREVLVKAL
jgi:DNA segregation ATPase FtsK/SpoIIIE, S-DNA-T family